MLKSFILTLLFFGILDFLWLGLIMPHFYLDELGDLVRKSGDKLDVYWPAGIAVYLLIAAGLTFFVYPSIDAMSYQKAFVWGAFFGLILYGVYDFTNLATLKNYSVKLSFIDTAWGAFASGLTTLLVKYFH